MSSDSDAVLKNKVKTHYGRRPKPTSGLHVQVHTYEHIHVQMTHAIHTLLKKQKEQLCLGTINYIINQEVHITHIQHKKLKKTVQFMISALTLLVSHGLSGNEWMGLFKFLFFIFPTT